MGGFVAAVAPSTSASASQRCTQIRNSKNGRCSAWSTNVGMMSTMSGPTRGLARALASSRTWATPSRPAESSSWTSGASRHNVTVRTRSRTSRSDQRTVALAQPRIEACPSAFHDPRRSASSNTATISASA